MPNHQSGQLATLDRLLLQGDLDVILLNALSGFGVSTDIAEILQYEAIQTTGGYQPQQMTYTAGSAVYNGALSKYEFMFPASFTAPGGGDPYSYTHAALIQGRGTNANKILDSVSTSTDVITVINHGLVSGDRVFIRSTAALPGGLTIQRYFAEVLDADEFKLHTNIGLTAPVNITSSGSGNQFLQYANGTIRAYDATPGTVNPGTTKTIDVYFRV